MMLYFPEITEAISKCKKHFKRVEPHERIIIAYLTDYLLIYMCRTYEGELSKLKDRVDNKVTTQLSASNKKNTRSALTLRWIEKNILKPCGSNAQDLEKRINDVAVLREYNNMVVRRNFVAHGGFSHIPISDLVANHKHAIRILTELDKIVA